jgi:hypothetical protein
MSLTLVPNRDRVGADLITDDGLTCDACHGYDIGGYVVRFADGKISRRCNTHAGSEFDRAAVRR